MRGLDGKVALVAGAGSGIGAATARRLAQEGASVVVGDINIDNAEEVASGIVETGSKAIAVHFDIAREDAVDELVTRTVDELGGLDAVHINAADLRPSVIGVDQESDAETVPLEIFDRTIEVNLRGHLLVTRRVVPELRARGGGSIVYTSSAAAFISGAMLASYATAKSGLLALSRHVARRWGKDGIRSNVVAPGLVLTDTVIGNTSPELREASVAACATPRLGEPEDIAAAVAFLMSADAEWITGQVLSVDGGMTMR